MTKELQGLKVAALMEDGFEEVELIGPAKMLKEAGVQVKVVSSKEDTGSAAGPGETGATSSPSTYP